MLEIAFCFTYCKMNQRFILWRLLFCWYIQYDKYIYIEYLCVLSIFDAVYNCDNDDDFWLIVHVQLTSTSKAVPRASGYLTPHSDFQSKFLLAFYAKFCQQYRLVAGGDCGKLYSSPTPMKTKSHALKQLKLGIFMLNFF